MDTHELHAQLVALNARKDVAYSGLRAANAAGLTGQAVTRFMDEMRACDAEMARLIADLGIPGVEMLFPNEDGTVTAWVPTMGVDGFLEVA